MRLFNRQWCIVTFLLAASFVSQPAPLSAADAGKPVLKKGDRLAIVGDSITEQKIYCRFMEDYLTVCTPELDLWIIQLGWSGEQAVQFIDRMQSDLMSFHPNVATFMYGMNDGAYRSYLDSVGKRYDDSMRKIASTLKAAGVTAVIGSPTCADLETWHIPCPPEVYNDTLARLGAFDKQIAKDYGVPFADVHTLMYDVMKRAQAAHKEEYAVCGPLNNCHPAENGHLIMAYTFLKAMGLSGDIGTITIDMAGGAKATDGHKVLSAKDGKVEIESTKYPFCFTTKPDVPMCARGILPFLPFNQDLNRMTLVVTGLKGDKATVTWGKESKVFTKAQLETGINLADEFLDNPFSDAFLALDKAVVAKQNYETFMIREGFKTLRTTVDPSKDDPEGAAAANVIRSRLLAKRDELAKAVKAAFVPVKHTIVITDGN